MKIQEKIPEHKVRFSKLLDKQIEDLQMGKDPVA